MTIGDVPLWFLRVFAVTFGLLWGSFLNVVIYRVPREMSVAFPASHCPTCGAPVRAYDNLPVLSFLILGGRTRCCKKVLSVRYPLVELIGGALSLAIVEVMLRGLPESTPLVRAGGVYLADLAICLGLVAAAFIDAEHMFLPDSITIGGTILGIATATLRGMPFTESLIGGAAGFAGVWLPFVFLYPKARRLVVSLLFPKAPHISAAMGMGDVKLTMLIGAWCGTTGLCFAVGAAGVQGALYGLATFLIRGKIEDPVAVQDDREELERLASEGDVEAKQILAEDPVHALPGGRGFFQAALPFGPFLILGMLEYLFAGPQIMEEFRSLVLGQR